MTRNRVIGAIGGGALALALGFGAISSGVPAQAQEAEPRLDMEEFKRRLDEAWEQMMRELGPTIDSLGALMETLDQIDSLGNYEKPEVLPNGDIVIRRKADAPPLRDAPDPDAPAGPPDATPGIKT